MIHLYGSKDTSILPCLGKRAPSHKSLYDGKDEVIGRDRQANDACRWPPASKALASHGSKEHLDTAPRASHPDDMIRA